MEIAKILNCSRSTYTYYETGKTTPSISVLKLLAKIYNVSLMELLMDESEAGPVSYTHLDVYKRQAVVLSISRISPMMVSFVTAAMLVPPIVSIALHI